MTKKIDVRIFVMGTVLTAKGGCCSIRDVVAHAREKSFPTMLIRGEVQWLVSVGWLKRLGQLLHPTQAALNERYSWVKGMKKLFTHEQGAELESMGTWDGTKLDLSLLHLSLDPENPSVLLCPGGNYTGEIELVGEAAAETTSRILAHQARRFEALAGGEK
jgi:hypothetical protein